MKLTTIIPFLLCQLIVTHSSALPPEKIGSIRKLCPSRVGQIPSRKDTRYVLQQLREKMTKEIPVGGAPLDAFIVTSQDEHLSEFVADHDKRLQFITGFSGSVGIAIITKNNSALWTDGRYHIQADNELSCDWLLMRNGQPNVPKEWEWLHEQFPNGGRVGADPKLIPSSEWDILETYLSRISIRLVESNNLIDLIWDSNERPPLPMSKAYLLDLKYAGESWTSKVESVRKEMNKSDADALVVTSLDEIAWLLNVRGRDIPYNPVVRSYLIIEKHEIHWYVSRNQIDENIEKNRNSNVEITDRNVHITMHNYEKFWSDLPTLSQGWKLAILPSRFVYNHGVSRAIYNMIPEHKRLLKPSPIISLKARKNSAEIRGMENAHIRDAVAMCDFMAYFELKFKNGHIWDELQIADQLERFRFEQKLVKGLSFPTIAGFGIHGALPHYEPNNFTNIAITQNSTLVIDSGGQYLDGTTDVTRTLHMGEPTQEQKSAYTRVLIGSIELSSLVFPSNMIISGADVVARAPLWKVGLDYMHGTGHGIGAFLNVHESPISVSYQHNHKQKFKEGYFFSNEPGYYEEGNFGIRLENILEVVAENGFKHHSGSQFLKFKDVTLVPYETKLMDSDLLDINHRRWLNKYNTRIRNLVGAELKKQFRMDGFYWMLEKTKHIPEQGPISGAASLAGTCIYVIFTILIVDVLFI